ncbi:MAG: hypothetical protein ABIP08_10390 [Lautropia sp.]
MQFVPFLVLVVILVLGPASAQVTTSGSSPDAASGPVVQSDSKAANEATAADAPPRSLLDTGLYRAGTASGAEAPVAPHNLAFAPQYPLWSDGAAKRRWLYLPPGTFIDATRPDAWEFPPGTRLWKEFSFQGRRVETRLIERRADRSWRFVSYVWNADGGDAVLVPAEGVMLDLVEAPTGRYAIPSREDCLACHEGAPVPVLGASTVQLSADLRSLVDHGLLRHLPEEFLAQPPKIAAASSIERAALGYLHGNCGHCHNHNGAPAPVRVVLAQTVVRPLESRERVLASAVDQRSRFRPAGMPGKALVIAPGSPDVSVLAWRMRSRHALVQMPPLGTLIPDDEGIALIERWIASDLTKNKESPP